MNVMSIQYQHKQWKTNPACFRCIKRGFSLVKLAKVSWNLTTLFKVKPWRLKLIKRETVLKTKVAKLKSKFVLFMSAGRLRQSAIALIVVSLVFKYILHVGLYEYVNQIIFNISPKRAEIFPVVSFSLHVCFL